MTLTAIKLRPQQKDALDCMKDNNKVRVIAATSAGKSYIIFFDIQQKMQQNEDALFIIVSSRVLLLQQLEKEYTKLIDNTHIVHMHSGESNSRKITNYLEFAYWAEVTKGPKVVFVTYHSLKKIVKSEVNIEALYLDECHNSVKRHFFEDAKAIEPYCKNLYSFTAAPKYHADPTKNGNNNTQVYGDVVYNVNTLELINNGSILSPRAIPMHIPAIRDKKQNPHERDYYTLMDYIYNNDNTDRVLITCPSSRALMDLICLTDFMQDLNDNGYDVFHITSKYGAFHNKTKINRSEFLNKMEEYGRENKKFIVLHYSILTEGWSNNSIQASILMRQQQLGCTVQNIGRTLRIGHSDLDRIQKGELVPGDYDNYDKPFGNIVIPVYENVGAKIEQQVDFVIDEVFCKGNYVHDLIKEKK